MSKWYVEYRAFGKNAYMGGIEAEDGNSAIEYVISCVIGVSCIRMVAHDDDAEIDGVYRGNC